MITDSSPGTGNIFFSPPQNVQTDFRAHLASYLLGNGILLRVFGVELTAQYLSSAYLTSEWS
jgi:hypothetical protein